MPPLTVLPPPRLAALRRAGRPAGLPVAVLPARLLAADLPARPLAVVQRAARLSPLVRPQAGRLRPAAPLPADLLPQARPACLVPVRPRERWAPAAAR